MAQLGMWIAFLTATAVVLTRYRTVSLVTLTLVGLAAYSLPALFGISLFLGERNFYYPASSEAIWAMALVWLGFVISILGASFFVSPYGALRQQTGNSNLFLLCSLAVSLGLMAVVALRTGSLFFALSPRGELMAEAGIFFLLWSWVIAIGLVASVFWKRRIYGLCFSALLLLVALSGDRTVPVLAAVSALLIFFWGLPNSRALRSPVTWVAVPVCVAAVVLVKPVYRAIKSGISILEINVSPKLILGQWEAFAIHEQLERVIASGFQFPLVSMIIAVIGQVLVIPSAFGINSSQFNDAVQPALFPDVDFGVAYNMWAQWFAMLGWTGPFVGGVVLGAVVVTLSGWVQRSRSSAGVLFVILGTIIAVYATRNSVENVVAIWRQVIIAYMGILLPYLILLLVARRAKASDTVQQSPGAKNR